MYFRTIFTSLVGYNDKLSVNRLDTEKHDSVSHFSFPFSLSFSTPTVWYKVSSSDCPATHVNNRRPKPRGSEFKLWSHSYIRGHK